MGRALRPRNQEKSSAPSRVKARDNRKVARGRVSPQPIRKPTQAPKEATWARARSTKMTPRRTTWYPKKLSTPVKSRQSPRAESAKGYWSISISAPRPGETVYDEVEMLQIIIGPDALARRREAEHLDAR